MMITMAKVLVTILSAGLLGVSGQNDWDCNHYQNFPADVCVTSGSLSFIFECNGTDAMNQYLFFDSGCEGTATWLGPVNASQFQCDQSVSCDYFTLTAYNYDNCTDLNVIFPFVSGQCESDDDDTSYSTDCTDDNSIVYTAYIEDDDCSGTYIQQYLSVEEAFGFFGSCIEV